MCGARGCNTFVADKASRRSLVTQRDVCVLHLDSSLFVYCGEKADTIEKELVTLLADLRFLLGNDLLVLLTPDDRFCSAQGGYSLRQKSFSFHEALG